MMSDIDILKSKREINADDFFRRYGQSAGFWVTCADCSFSPQDFNRNFGDSFVLHKNAANLVLPTDLNCIAAMHYAVEVKKAETIIVCGHYKCEIVASVLEKDKLRLDFLDNWLLPIRKIAAKYEFLLKNLAEETKIRALCELNVFEQACNAENSYVVREARQRGRKIEVLALIFDPDNYSFFDLNFSAENYNSFTSRCDSMRAANTEYREMGTCQSALPDCL